MKSEHLTPLALDMQTLLLDEKAAPPPPADLQAQIGARLAETLGLANLPTPDAGGGELPTDLGAPQLASANTALSPLAAIAAKPLLVALAAFGLGTGAGIGGTLLATQSDEVVERAPKPAIVSQVRPDAGSSRLLAEPVFDVTPDTLPVVPSEHETPKKKSARAREPEKNNTGGENAGAKEGGRDEALAAERALIELSRTAITRGDGKTALFHLAKHKVSHRNGRLAEEREALWIQALFIEKSYKKAKARAEKFTATYPKSLFMPVVEQVLAELP